MKPGIATWDELEPLSGNVLLVINSERGDTDEVAAVLNRLGRRAPPAALHVIAGPQWLDWLAGRGVDRDRILAAADAAGVELELNHFIESPGAVHWSSSKEFRVIVGSSAHSLHNDEIKTIFEQRACLLLRDAVFLAHALPSPFLYVLDATELLERFARDAKQASYESATRAVVEDLHQAWIRRGRPGPDDRAESTGAFGIMMARLGSGLAAYDENAGPSLPSRTMPAASRDLIFHLSDVVHDHAELWEALAKEVQRLSAVVDERNAAVAQRDANNAEIAEERSRAVSQRDAIIDRLRQELTRLTSGWRRAVNGRPKV